jgi:hypothetical protein
MSEALLLDKYTDQIESDSVSAELDRRGATFFLAAHPEFYGSPKNAQLLQDWINERGGCGSARNFTLAYRALQNSGKLEKRPLPKLEPVGELTMEERGITSLRNLAYVRNGENITSQDRAEFADKPYESDVARKKRDENLRRAATADRIARTASK